MQGGPAGARCTDESTSERCAELVKTFGGRDDYANAPVEAECHGKRVRFRDRAFGRRWQRFHADQAVLRAEDATDNLRGNVGFARGRPCG